MANLRYVTAEFTYSGWLTGLLRAGSTTVGPYERFTFAGWTGNIVIRSISFNLPVVLDTAPAEVAGNLRARNVPRGPVSTWTLIFDNLCRDTGCNYYDPYEVGCAANAVEVAAVQALDGTTTTAKIFSSTLCPGFSWAQGTESALSNAPPTNDIYSLTFSQSESPTGPATSYTEMLCCVAPDASGANTPMAPDSLWVWACIHPYESAIPEACTTRH